MFHGGNEMVTQTAQTTHALRTRSMCNVVRNPPLVHADTKRRTSQAGATLSSHARRQIEFSLAAHKRRAVRGRTSQVGKTPQTLRMQQARTHARACTVLVTHTPPLPRTHSVFSRTAQHQHQAAAAAAARCACRQPSPSHECRHEEGRCGCWPACRAAHLAPPAAAASAAAAAQLEPAAAGAAVGEAAAPAPC